VTELTTVELVEGTTTGVLLDEEATVDVGVTVEDSTVLEITTLDDEEEDAMVDEALLETGVLLTTGADVDDNTTDDEVDGPEKGKQES